MSEPKKLTEEELDTIRAWHRADVTFDIDELSALHVGELLNHIDAITAEHDAEMTRAREDADRVGAARVEFEDQQQKRIEALEQMVSDLKAEMRFDGEQDTGRPDEFWGLFTPMIQLGGNIQRKCGGTSVTSATSCVSESPR